MKSAVEALRIALKRLPGVGPKTAQRMAFHLLEKDRDGARQIMDSINLALNSVTHCKRCNNFSESELCEICAHPGRDNSLLCVVETPADLESIEQAGAYRGLYMVLMGHLAPLDGMGPESIAIGKLLDVVEKYSIAELVLATNLTIEGESTADYIASLFLDKSIKVSRLARGVPVGGELEYMDAGTLNQAFAERRSIGHK